MNKTIDIHKVRDFAEDKINKRINEINDPNIDPGKKRLYVLNMYNSSNLYSESIDFPNNTKQIFDINKIRAFREKKVEENMKNIKNEKLSEKQKRLLVLDKLNTSSSSNDKEVEEEEKGAEEEKETEEKEEKEGEKRTEEIKNISISMDSNIKTDCSSSISVLEEEREKYCLENKLYDIYDTKIKDGNFKYLTSVSLEKDKKCFLYKNDLITYYFIKNFRFGDFFINDDILTDNQYNKSYGLFFCGNEIKLENNEIKKCCPNEMICKQCMEKNKKRYKLKNRYLININGRATKKHKEKFHCFGNFVIGNQYENCIDKFSCKACQLLDKYEKYYFP